MTALSLTLILAVFVTSLEQARIQAERAWAEEAQEAALESVFAAYYLPMWENYHLMTMADGSHLAERMEEYLTWYEEDAGETVWTSHHEEIKFEEVLSFVDADGEAFQNEIRKDMENHAAELLTDKLLPFESMLKDAKSLGSLAKKMSSAMKIITQASREVNRIRESGRRLSDRVDSMQSYLEEPAWARESAQEMLDQIQREAETLAAENEEVRRKLDEAAAEFETAGEEGEETGDITDPDGAAFEQTENQELEEYEKDGTDITGTKAFTRKVAQVCQKIAGIPAPPEDEAQQDDWRQAISEASEMLHDITKDEDAAKTLRKDGEAAQGFSLLQMASQIAKKGVWSILLPGNAVVSDAWIPAVERPSQLVKGASDGWEASQLAEDVMTAQYAVTHFSFYGTEREETRLKYEAEYLLSGKNSDSDNLKETAEKLFLLRTGLNLLYLLKDSSKRAEVSEAALLLTGGNAMMSVLAEGMLLCAWAMAEAAVDVRGLLGGSAVPLIKQEGDWKTSLTHAAESFAAASATGERVTDGWNYKRYLCVLYVLQDRNKGLFRMMDLMEVNLQQEDPGFLIENCIQEAKVRTTFRRGEASLETAVRYGYES